MLSTEWSKYFLWLLSYNNLKLYDYSFYDKVLYFSGFVQSNCCVCPIPFGRKKVVELKLSAGTYRHKKLLRQHSVFHFFHEKSSSKKCALPVGCTPTIYFLLSAPKCHVTTILVQEALSRPLSVPLLRRSKEWRFSETIMHFNIAVLTFKKMLRPFRTHGGK